MATDYKNRAQKRLENKVENNRQQGRKRLPKSQNEPKLDEFPHVPKPRILKDVSNENAILGDLKVLKSTQKATKIDTKLTLGN